MLELLFGEEVFAIPLLIQQTALPSLQLLLAFGLKATVEMTPFLFLQHSEITPPLRVARVRITSLLVERSVSQLFQETLVPTKSILAVQ
jgi:hypothetical protein